MAMAPPDPPSPMMTETKGTPSPMQQSVERGQEVEDIMRRYSEVDARIYAVVTRELGWKEAA